MSTTLLIEGEMLALTSISHIGSAHGIRAIWRREKVIQPDGAVEDIPIYSGNALRGQLRDLLALHMLDTLGYNQQGGRRLPLPAFHLLTSGGALTKSGTALDLGEAQALRQTVPLLALFGGAIGSYILPGQLRVDKVIPICAETQHLLPDAYAGGALPSIWDFCQSEAYTRRDDARDARKALYADTLARALTDAPQQMRYHVETLAAGARFLWSVALEDPDDLLWDTLCFALKLFEQHPFLGGKSNVGHGRVRLVDVQARWGLSERPAALTDGSRYLAHLENQREAICEALNSIQ